MEILIKAVGTLVLILAIIFGGVHLFGYVQQGGLRTNFGYNLMIFVLSIFALAVLVRCIMEIWKKT